MGLLLDAQEPSARPSDREICSELLLLLWAGHDTVASLLTWICYELALHPELAERARREALSAGDGAPSAEQLRALPLLDAVIREGERLHPPAPGGFRGVCESFEYGGWAVPRGWLACAKMSVKRSGLSAWVTRSSRTISLPRVPVSFSPSVPFRGAIDRLPL